jgi:hypothetical protein
MEMDRVNIQPRDREEPPPTDDASNRLVPTEESFESMAKNFYLWRNDDREYMKPMDKRQIVQYIMYIWTGRPETDEYLTEEDLNEDVRTCISLFQDWKN